MKSCPRCKQSLVMFPALSRYDNLTEVCSVCGMAEALEQAGLYQKYSGIPYWEVPIHTQHIEQLQAETGRSMTECLEALKEAKGHMDIARQILEV